MKTALITLTTLWALLLHAQEYPRTNADLNRIADELYGAQDLDISYEDLYENLVQLLSTPLNLNRVTDEDLRFLHVLTESQIKSFMEYRSSNTLLSVYELQAIPGFDISTIMKLVPFVKIMDPAASVDASLWRRIKKESDNYFIARVERTLQTRKGYSGDIESGFKGSPDKLYLRFRSSRPGDFSMGFTAEKDPGEQFRWSPSSRSYGADYISFHVQLQNKGRLRNLVLGDFQSQFGQGLMLGGIFGMGKGGETITTVRRSNIGLLPYTSVFEAGGLRGAGTTLQLTRRLYLTGFYSRTWRDAAIATDTLDDPVTSSIQRTGFHRNDNELAARKKITDLSWGTVIQYKFRQLDAGIMFNSTRFSAPVVPKQNAYNQFAFSGNANSNLGIYLNYSIENIAFFGEASKTLGGGSAYIGGILWSLIPQVDLSILYRRFDRDFHAFYSNAFAENSSTQNERGLYWGWKYTINHRFNLSGYIDLFRFPWLKYRTYSPSLGHEWLLRLTYQPSRKVMIVLQAREEIKDRNISDKDGHMYAVGQGTKHNYWVTSEYGLRQKLRIKNRVQFSTYNFNHRLTSGFVLLQDISLDIWKFQVTARYALFDTDDYDNRQYVYENDVLLAYSMPAYFGVGVRKMILLEYKMSRHVTFWMRFANIRYPNDEKIGTGQDTIDGNVRNDVKFQVRITF